MPTETRKSPSQMKSSKWCITYWLTDGRTEETLKRLTEEMPENWALEGQIEQGYSSDDKLHAQLFLRTEWTRGTKITKYFPDCYIDEAKNPFALKKYVHKTETRVGEFKTIENRSPQWPLVRNKFFDWLLANEIAPDLITDELDDRLSPRLTLWDKFCNQSLAEGVYIELVCVNPQYRSVIRRCWLGLIADAYRRSETSTDRQTDRQTEVEIPMVVADPPLRVKKTVKVFLPKE